MALIIPLIFAEKCNKPFKFIGILEVIERSRNAGLEPVESSIFPKKDVDERVHLSLLTSSKPGRPVEISTARD
jgi:hypothetical protein